MKHDFWHERWESNQIGFHEGRTNRMLAAHLGALRLAEGARIFLPLCGKAHDIHWLHAQGFHVVGAELSEIAIRQLFDEMGLKPNVSTSGALTHFSANRMDIFVGDIFDLTADQLGPVNAVYDRAALVALPPDLRTRYSSHVPHLTATAQQLVITFEYDQSLMDGPPFSLGHAVVRGYFEDAYSAKALATQPMESPLKGIAPASETAWLMTPRQT